ncbi:MAG: hypothetical protein ACLR6J_12605 [Parabacteroides merdae]
MTQTNWEAIQVACLLKDKRMPVRLIQSNEGFRLCDMDEMRFFNRILGSQAEVHLIDEVCWAEGRNKLLKMNIVKLLLGKFAGGLFRISNNFIPVSIVRIGKRICLNRSWKISMPFGRNYRSFHHDSQGKREEFDNVFLLLNDNRDLLRGIISLSRMKRDVRFM